jgi:hypothetical protein
VAAVRSSPPPPGSARGVPPPPQHGVDQAGDLLPPHPLRRPHGLEDRNPRRRAGVEDLVGAQAQGVARQGVGLVDRPYEQRGEGEIEGAAAPKRPHHKLGQERPVPGKGKRPLRPVEEDVRVRLSPVHPEKNPKRRIPYGDSRSPFRTRRPCAYSQADIALPPSG